LKLAEIKSGLIGTFFTEDSAGVPHDQIDPIFESIGKSIGLDLGSDKLTVLAQTSNQSSDPSKAFKRFTEGRISILTIYEEDGLKQNVIFVAVRAGTQAKSMDLTSPLREATAGLGSVKNALRQAKNRNEDIVFNLIISDRI